MDPGFYGFQISLAGIFFVSDAIGLLVEHNLLEDFMQAAAHINTDH